MASRAETTLLVAVVLAVMVIQESSKEEHELQMGVNRARKKKLRKATMSRTRGRPKHRRKLKPSAPIVRSIFGIEKSKKRKPKPPPEKIKGVHIQPDGRTRGQMRRERAERHRLRLEGRPARTGKPYNKKLDPEKPFDHDKRRQQRAKLRERKKRKRLGQKSEYKLNTTFFNVELQPGPVGLGYVGQKIQFVDPTKQAAQLGLKAKMRIVAVNGTKARTQKLLDKLINSCKEKQVPYIVTIMKRTLVPRKTPEQIKAEKEKAINDTKLYFQSLGLNHDGHAIESSVDASSAIEEEPKNEKKQSGLLDEELDNKVDYAPVSTDDERPEAEDGDDATPLSPMAMYLKRGRIKAKEWSRMLGRY